MSQDPSPYDLLQDSRIEGIEEVVHPYYQPPGDQEYSFPVVGQGISSQQFQQISRAAGTGVYTQHDPGGAQSAYLLVGMPGGDSETNATNQMILKVAAPTGRNEAVIDGFFHTQTEDMIIDFPPVTTPTTYYLCLTYDPRREEEPEGPIRVEVHTNDLPRTHNRKHIVLWTVEREPNQLLANARIQHSLSWISPVISVFSSNQLPDPSSVVYGTLGVAIHGAGPNMPTVYASRGHHGWIKTSDGPVGPWESVFQGANGWTGGSGSESPRARITPMGVQLRGFFFRNNATNSTFGRITNSRFRPPRRLRIPIASSGSATATLIIDPDGDMTFAGGWNGSSVSVDGIIYPIDF